MNRYFIIVLLVNIESCVCWNSFVKKNIKLSKTDITSTRRRASTIQSSRGNEYTKHDKNNPKRQRLISNILSPTAGISTRLQAHKQKIEERKRERNEDGYSDLSCTHFGGVSEDTPMWKRILNMPINIGHTLTRQRYRKTPGQLILVRHGESMWNANKTFTGWADPDLSPQGYREIEHAARLLLEGGYEIDIVFTSRLRRAIRSTWVLLQELNEIYLPVFKSWRLNERMYGALQGLSKSETATKLGVGLVQQWRASLNARPPPVYKSSQYYPGNDRRYMDLDESQIPKTESLLDCMERTEPLWKDKIIYELKAGRNVLVVAHANTLRGLIKIMDNIGDEEIQNVGLPTGIPVIYKFDQNLRPIPQVAVGKSANQMHMTGIFLEKPGQLKVALKREREWIALEPNYNSTMVRNKRPMTALERSLYKLQAETELSQWASAETMEEEEEDDGTDGKISLLDQPFSQDSADVTADEIEVNEDDITTTLSSISQSSSLVNYIHNDNRGINGYRKQKNSEIVMIRHGVTEYNKLGIFSGWQDIPLSTEGVEEAKQSGRLLKKYGYEFDVVYTSWLSRAIETAWFILDELDTLWLPIVKTWRLNERMYGKLTGLSKTMVAQRHGKSKFLNWRRGYHHRPPKVSSFSPFYPGNDIRYVKYVRDLRISWRESFIRSMDSQKPCLHRKLPKTESLKDCMERTIPYFLNHIVPEAIEKNKRVLISSSENAIRGLLMHLLNIPPEDIVQLDIPNGVPIVYDMESRKISFLYDDDNVDDNLNEEMFSSPLFQQDYSSIGFQRNFTSVPAL